MGKDVSERRYKHMLGRSASPKKVRPAKGRAVPSEGVPFDGVRLATPKILTAALVILKGSRAIKEWKGVSKGIWLLDALAARIKSHLSSPT